MNKGCLASILLVVMWGCAPPEAIEPTGSLTPVSATPVATVTPILSSTPIKSPVPLPPLPQPDFPPEVFKPYQVATLDPKIKDSEIWWADSGISDNRIGYYTSNESAAQIESELLPSFTASGNKPYLDGIGPVFDYEGNRVCLMKRAKDEVLFVIVPLGADQQIPDSLKALKLPSINSEKLKDKTCLVILASGQGLGEHVDHMLGQAGLVITPTPTDK